MRFYLKKNLIIDVFLILFSILGIFFQFPLKAEEIDFDSNFPELIVSQGNTLIAIPSSKTFEEKIIKRLNVIVTAYSSSPWETDANPYITAAGTRVRDGIAANNLLPIGTKIKIPEIFGDKTFVIEDRMNKKKGEYQIDIWFKNYWEAKEFGVKRTYIEILES